MRRLRRLHDVRAPWGLVVFLGGFATTVVVLLFLKGRYIVGGGLTGGMLLAVLFALWVGRVHRSKRPSDPSSNREA